MISFFLVMFAAICNAVMDKVSFHYSSSIFARGNDLFWNPSNSWKNKWKNGNKEEGERFFLSSSVFVFVTDAWHLFKSTMTLFLFFAIVFYKPVLGIFDFLIFKFIFGGTFHLFFHKIFNK